MEVSIIEKETGKSVGSYMINLAGVNYLPSDEEYFSEAWRCAAEDGIVKADSREKYAFSVGK